MRIQQGIIGFKEPLTLLPRRIVDVSMDELQPTPLAVFIRDAPNDPSDYVRLTVTADDGVSWPITLSMAESTIRRMYRK